MLQIFGAQRASADTLTTFTVGISWVSPNSYPVDSGTTIVIDTTTGQVASSHVTAGGNVLAFQSQQSGAGYTQLTFSGTGVANLGGSLTIQFNVFLPVASLVGYSGGAMCTATNSCSGGTTAEVIHCTGSTCQASDQGTFTANTGLVNVAPGAFGATGAMGTARRSHTTTLLPNGKVLITGGYVLLSPASYAGLASAELYDPATATFLPTGPMSAGRFGHTATLLPNGKVLIAGGDSGCNNCSFGGSGSDTVLATTEIYDPNTGTFAPAGTLNTARYNHTATLLGNGKVLLVQGTGLTGALASAELFDPTMGTSQPVSGSLSTAFNGMTATLLANGKVLIVGNNAELFDPATGTFQSTGSLNTARTFHTATALPIGKVLIAGGENSSFLDLTSAELYDPAGGSFSLTGSMATARAGHTSTLLPNGMVLLAGGSNNTQTALGESELYDPVSGTFGLTGALNTARSRHTATLLPDGKVLLAGGEDFHSNTLASAELYVSATSANSADFSLSFANTTASAAVGGSATYQITVTPSNGFTDTVQFSVNGLPLGTTASFSPIAITAAGSTTLTISTTSSTPEGRYFPTVTATSGSLTHTTGIILDVKADFSVNVTPLQQTVSLGNPAKFQGTVTPFLGFNRDVSVSISGLPANTTVELDPLVVIGGSGKFKFTISANSQVIPGTYTLTVMGTSLGQTSGTTTTLIVQ